MTLRYSSAACARSRSAGRRRARSRSSRQPGLALSQVEIGKLPLYNQDQDPDPPADWIALRERIRKADAVLFVTPEYNRSVPGVLKNAIDIGVAALRPERVGRQAGRGGQRVARRKIGGFGANHHLRQSLVFLNVPALQQPEVYLSGADKLFDADGKLQDAQTREFLQGFTRAFEKFIARFVPQK